MRDDLHLQFQLAMLLAELFNLGANFFQQFPRFRELFCVRAGKLRWIGKRPVQPFVTPAKIGQPFDSDSLQTVIAYANN